MFEPNVKEVEETSESKSIIGGISMVQTSFRKIYILSKNGFKTARILEGVSRHKFYFYRHPSFGPKVVLFFSMTHKLLIYVGMKCQTFGTL